MKIVQPGFEILSKLDGPEILKFIEQVGRVCYKSEDKITDDSAERFVANLIKRGHEAVIEHVAVTVKFTNDRGVSHEEVRHRIASFAQESTRYCNYSAEKFGKHVSFIDIRGGMELDPKVKSLTADQFNAIYNEWMAACGDAERHYFNMLGLGATPQIARSVLNNSTKTELCVTMNLREWRHFFKLRTDTPAHPQMREVTIPLLREFQRRVPVVFDDIKIPEDTKEGIA